MLNHEESEEHMFNPNHQGCGSCLLLIVALVLTLLSALLGNQPGEDRQERLQRRHAIEWMTR